MKKTILLLLALVAMQAHAQFTYSVKAGWSWPDFKNNHWTFSPSSGITFGGTIDYDINGYLGLQAGLNYKRTIEYYTYEGGRLYENPAFKREVFSANIPLLLTASVIQKPERWRAIWNVGPYVDLPIVTKGRLADDEKIAFGIMAALQIEVLSHYFVRGEYQWALTSDIKEDWDEDRRANMVSVSLGYRF